MAWTMYKPFVTRGLALRGYSPVDAIKMIDERTPTARHVLDELMKEKPILMDRAPTWHKFNIMAFKPFITDGKEIRVSPLIDSGFNMDHDGDMQIGEVKIEMKSEAINQFIASIEKSDPAYCKSIINMLYLLSLNQKRGQE